MTEKPKKSSTIELSIATINKLHSVQDTLQKILCRKHVSYDEVLRVLFATYPLDVVLINMMLGDELEECKA